MEKSELKIKVRTELGKNAVKRLRRQGLIPAVVYGPNIKPTPVSIAPDDLKKAISTTAGLNTLITIKSESNGDLQNKVVMLREYQIDPIERVFIHADLYEVPLHEKIVVNIPIQVTGKAIGVEAGGILQLVTRELSVKCLPSNIPASIGLDVTNLKIGASIHVKDITLPEGVEPVADSDITIVSVVAPISEEEFKAMEAAAQAPPELAEPEVIGKEEEAAEGEEAAPEGEEKAEKPEKAKEPVQEEKKK